MHRFEHADQIGDYPAVAAMGALVYALSGDEAATDRWASQVAASDVAGAEDLPAPAWILRALLAREGIAQVRADARAARLGESADPAWLAAALELEGFSYLWDGETERADSLLARAAAAGEWFSGLPAATSALAARAVIALGRDDWETAEHFADRSLDLIREHGLELYLTSGLAFAVATRCAVRHDKIGEARNLLAQAAAIRPRLTNATPGVAVQTLLEMTKAHVEIGDIAGARLVMREASDILAKRHDLGLLSSQYEEIKTRLQAHATTEVGALVLTSAELRLLPYLTTHLSFPEIGERLFISRHTVKTQAMSIYRKLGTSSRSEVVHRAREVGLLTT
jgi:LuxR family maltose regulon positive regulatory protein